MTLLLAVLAGAAVAAVPPESVAEALAIASQLAEATGPDGHTELVAQADRITLLPADWVVPCLAAFRDATPPGANWLRSGLDRANDRLGDTLSADTLAAAACDAGLAPRARSLAFGWLKDRHPARAESLLDTMLDDPALDLRRAAVEKLLAAAAAASEVDQQAAYRRGLTAARDIDQLERIAAWLTEHGGPVDVAAVLGFVRQWRVSGEFDNAGGGGFGQAYPPESDDPAVLAAGNWQAVTSADKHGTVDLNATIALKKGVLAYAVATVEMPAAGPAEVRIGSPCAITVWVNGTPVMSHEIYHASEAIDQYVAVADFRAGSNVVLVKCCQNEQTEPWAVDWKFQLRICDPLGKPLATQPPKDKL